MSSLKNHLANQNAQKIFANINQLVLSKYSKNLTKDEQFILICLVSGMNSEEIATAHGQLKLDEVQTISASLIDILSQYLEENITLDNIEDIVQRHFLALEKSE